MRFGSLIPLLFSQKNNKTSELIPDLRGYDECPVFLARVRQRIEGTIESIRRKAVLHAQVDLSEDNRRGEYDAFFHHILDLIDPEILLRERCSLSVEWM